MRQGLIDCVKKIFLRNSEKPQEDGPMVSKMQANETSVLQPAYTKRLKPDRDTGQSAPQNRKKRKAEGNAESNAQELSITWYGSTDTGKVRNHNEDYFSCLDLNEGSLFVVADGMGGHDAGEDASKLAVETVAREIQDSIKKKCPTGKLLEQAVQYANREVLAEAVNRNSNMGTTLTLALLREDKAYVANVGDSRIYWIENGSINRITEDHSLVEKLVSLGKLTREEARKHPKSNVLYRNIGSEGDVLVDTFEINLKKGGSLLLCSDGLWGEVAEEEIHRVFQAEKEAGTVCKRLIQIANENGGKDNITAVVVKVT